MLKAIFICALVAGVQGSPRVRRCAAAGKMQQVALKMTAAGAAPDASIVKELCDIIDSMKGDAACATLGTLTAAYTSTCSMLTGPDAAPTSAPKSAPSCGKRDSTTCNPFNAITQKHEDKCLSSYRFSCSARVESKSSVKCKDLGANDCQDNGLDKCYYFNAGSTTGTCVEKSSVECKDLGENDCRGLDKCYFQYGQGAATETCVEKSSVECATLSSADQCLELNSRTYEPVFGHCYWPTDDDGGPIGASPSIYCMEKSAWRGKCEDIDFFTCSTTFGDRCISIDGPRTLGAAVPNTDCIDKLSANCADFGSHECGENTHHPGLARCYWQNFKSTTPRPNSFGDTTDLGGACVDKSDVKCEDLDTFQCDDFKSCSYELSDASDPTTGACVEKAPTDCSKLSYSDCMDFKYANDCQTNDLGFQCAEPKDVVCSTIRDRSDCVFPCYYKKDGSYSNCVTAPPKQMIKFKIPNAPKQTGDSTQDKATYQKVVDEVKTLLASSHRNISKDQPDFANDDPGEVTDAPDIAIDEYGEVTVTFDSETNAAEVKEVTNELNEKIEEGEAKFTGADGKEVALDKSSVAVQSEEAPPSNTKDSGAASGLELSGHLLVAAVAISVIVGLI